MITAGIPAVQGHDDIIALLIQHETKVNMTDLTGWNALHYAYAGGQSNTVKLLISLGIQSIKNSDELFPHKYANP